MSELPDDLDIQRRLEPVRAAVMEATLHVRSPRRSTRFRTTRNLLIAGVAIAALTGGAIVYAQATREYTDRVAECYEHPSLDAKKVSGADVQPGFDPIEVCGSEWEYAFGVPTPELVACTLPSGAAAVFPREDGPSDDTDFCAALGLAEWDSD